MKEQIEDNYHSIWKEFRDSSFKDLLERGFTYQYDPNESDSEVLFIGINPSYSSGGAEFKSYTREEAVNYPYFKPFDEISQKVSSDSKPIKWTHIDLLVFRETRQKRIEEELFQSEEGLDFIIKQLNVARKRILHIRPKVMVVSNSLARTLLGKDRGENSKGEFNVWLGFRFEFDDRLGTHRIIEPSELKGTPVFFSSMLSGQRALDNGSKERLIWHIKKAMEEA